MDVVTIETEGSQCSLDNCRYSVTVSHTDLAWTENNNNIDVALTLTLHSASPVCLLQLLEELQLVSADLGWEAVVVAPHWALLLLLVDVHVCCSAGSALAGHEQLDVQCECHSRLTANSHLSSSHSQIFLLLVVKKLATVTLSFPF